MGRYDVRAKADQDVDRIAEYIGARNATAGRNFILARVVNSSFSRNIHWRGRFA